MSLNISHTNNPRYARRAYCRQRHVTNCSSSDKLTSSFSKNGNSYRSDVRKAGAYNANTCKTSTYKSGIPFYNSSVYDEKNVSRRAIIAFVCVVATLTLTFACLGGIDAFGSIGRAIGLELGSSHLYNTSTSTPASQYKRGEMPYLYQTDSAWAQTPYAGGSIGTHGCGPTSLSMAYVFLTGRTGKDPVALCKLAENGGYVDSGYTSWTFMTEGAKAIGLNSHELPANKEAVSAQLRMGHPVICSVGPGDFTTDGHFIVLSSIDDNGNVSVRDPNSQERSKRTWTLSQILPQCRNLWAMSV